MAKLFLFLISSQSLYLVRIMNENSGIITREVVVCDIRRQGGPVVNGGHVIARGENVVAVEVDMKSKRCAVLTDSLADDGAPVIWLDGEGALHLMPGAEKEETEVAFPEYKGWRVFVAEVCRYTLRVCLVRDEARPAP